MRELNASSPMLADIITTAGVGKCIAPACDGDYAVLLDNSTAGFPIASTAVRAFQFNLDRTISVNRVVLNLSAATGNAGSKALVGIYDKTQTLLFECDFDATSATIQSITLSQTITLTPGTYYIAWGCTATTGGVTAALGLAVLAAWTGIMNKNFQRTDTALNVVTGGHLPATLGGLSAVNSGSSVLCILLES